MVRDENRCPSCGGPMVSRQNSKTGQRFWGCTKYPRCKGTRDTDGLSADDRRQAAGLPDHPDDGDDDEGDDSFRGDRDTDW